MLNNMSMLIGNINVKWNLKLFIDHFNSIDQIHNS